jgi:hypothetical protein
VNTGRLTRAMLLKIFDEVRDHIDDGPEVDGASVRR